MRRNASTRAHTAKRGASRKDALTNSVRASKVSTSVKHALARIGESRTGSESSTAAAFARTFLCKASGSPLYTSPVKSRDIGSGAILESRLGTFDALKLDVAVHVKPVAAVEVDLSRIAVLGSVVFKRR